MGGQTQSLREFQEWTIANTEGQYLYGRARFDFYGEEQNFYGRATFLRRACSISAEFVELSKEDLSLLYENLRVVRNTTIILEKVVKTFYEAVIFLLRSRDPSRPPYI